MTVVIKQEYHGKINLGNESNISTYERLENEKTKKEAEAEMETWK